MSFKSFLTFLAMDDPNEALDDVLEMTSVAQAHLDIVLLGVLHSPPVVLHDVAPAAEWVRHNQEITQTAFDRVAAIEDYAHNKGVSVNVTAECDYPGNLEKIAERYALCADLHIGSASSLKANTAIARTFDGTVFGARSPFLLLPEEPYKPEDMTKIAIAWNGRVEASHAVRNALPLIKKAERVNIIVIDPVEGDVGEDPGSDLAMYLSRYGLKITIDVLASGGMTVAQKLMQRVRDIDADLLVMGCYGHTRFREWLLGGATREMLESAEIPVFMSH